MKVIDNITTTVRDDLQQTIRKGSKVSIAAACFSIYAYQELKKQLEHVDEIRFIFTPGTKRSHAATVFMSSFKRI